MTLTDPAPMPLARARQLTFTERFEALQARAAARDPRGPARALFAISLGLMAFGYLVSVSGCNPPSSRGWCWSFGRRAAAPNSDRGWGTGGRDSLLPWP